MGHLPIKYRLNTETNNHSHSYSHSPTSTLVEQVDRHSKMIRVYLMLINVEFHIKRSQLRTFRLLLSYEAIL